MRHLYFIAIVILTTISCNNDDPSSMVTTGDLIGCWNHDIEVQSTESSTTFLLSRCESKEFPQSWYRYSLIFDEDNKGLEFLLAENDAHSYYEMTWRLSDNTLAIDGHTQKIEYTVEVIDDQSILLTKK